MLVRRRTRGALALLGILLLACNAGTVSTALPSPGPQTPVAAGPTATRIPSPTPRPTSTPPEPLSALDVGTVAALDLVSAESLFATLEDLTAIRPYAGWRNAASAGEREALDYLAARLGDFAHLQGLGLELERQAFNVFVGTEIRASALELRVGGRGHSVPAAAMRGLMDDLDRALRYDSDGALNDAHPDPLTVDGAALVVRSLDDLDALTSRTARGKIVFVDYALVDMSVVDPLAAWTRAEQLLAARPAGMVLVTTFSNVLHASHGAFVGDTSIFDMASGPATPMLYARVEDLAAAGIETWDDFDRLESARLTWDADVLSPAASGNLVARIPGVDSSRAVILGAHADSPNSPGALDDGSGSAVLLEVARVIDAAGIRPATDVYLVWFGSEELIVYGSFNFASTHQELLDRTLAMLQVDCLLRPLDGVEMALALDTWSYGRLGDDSLPWTEYVTRLAAGQGIELLTQDKYEIESDNTAFNAFDVPNANLIYGALTNDVDGELHYLGHLHDPYDEVALARDVQDEFVALARVAVLAALETGRSAPDLRVTPKPARRAVFVGSHTEPAHMSPVAYTDLGMALAMEGYDVDLIPYGQAVTAADLAGADLVFALPVVDYPTAAAGNLSAYDDAWGTAEVAALVDYVARGGHLVLANSMHRLWYSSLVSTDPNEDTLDMNALAEPFGVAFRKQALESALASADGASPLLDGVTSLALIGGNGVAFEYAGGTLIAETTAGPAAVLIDHGDAGGQVLVLADVGMLGADLGEPANLRFWRNIANKVPEW